jgi:hypothetical protein
MTNLISKLRIAGLCLVVLLGAPAVARAQFFISPLIGYDFGGNAGCPEISNCTDKKLNYGVALGGGGLIGFEEEIAVAKNFFGDAPGLTSSVLTVMSNFRIAPAIGPVVPYVVVGTGLMKSHVDFTTASLLQNNNGFAFDYGGGLAVIFGHIGVRGDVRFFQSVQALKLLGLAEEEDKLEFGRAAVGLVFKF